MVKAPGKSRVSDFSEAGREGDLFENGLIITGGECFGPDFHRAFLYRIADGRTASGKGNQNIGFIQPQSVTVGMQGGVSFRHFKFREVIASKGSFRKRHGMGRKAKDKFRIAFRQGRRLLFLNDLQRFVIFVFFFRKIMTVLFCLRYTFLRQNFYFFGLLCGFRFFRSG